MSRLFHLLGYDASPIQTIEAVRLDLAWGWAALFLLCFLLLPAVVFLYRLEERPCDSWLRRRLIGLRLLFLAGVLFLLAGPRFVVTGLIPQKNKVAVLLDTSRSMSIKEDDKTRLDRIKDALKTADLLNALEQKTGISPSLFGFAGQVTPLSRDDVDAFTLSPDGDQTNISRAVTEIAGNLGQGNLLAAILLTDGAHNQGESPIDALHGFRVPLYFLGAGKPGNIRDLAISLERPPAVGFLNSQLRIRGELKTRQIATPSITLELKEDGKLLDSRTLSLEADKTTTNFSFQIPCSLEGQFTYTVSAPKFPGELTEENNESAFLLKVVKERLKVQAICGQPHWDISFLKGAVRGDPNAHFNAFSRITDTRWAVTRDFEVQRTIPAPDWAEAIGDADILVLRDVEAQILEPHAELLQKRLEAGKLGVCFFMGSRSLKALGYDQSPLKSILPVDPDGEVWKRQACNINLAAVNDQHAFLRLVDDRLENREFFRTLPKWEGLFGYPNLKKGAEVLLSSTIEGEHGFFPALMAHRVGRGNVALFAGGPLWPMGFRLVPTGKGIKPYTAFMVNLLKWLANRREDAQVVLDLPSSRGFIGQSSVFRVWVSDPQRQPIDSAQVGGAISTKSGDEVKLSFLATSEKGCYETTFVPSHRGLHDIQVEARHQGQLLGEAKAQFLVEVPTIEYDNPEVREDVMAALASATGGAYLPVERAGELTNLIIPSPGHKREAKTVEIRDNWLLLAVLLVLPLIEWIIRRTRGFS
jgi:hypothetical protein